MLIMLSAQDDELITVMLFFIFVIVCVFFAVDAYMKVQRQRKLEEKNRKEIAQMNEDLDIAESLKEERFLDDAYWFDENRKK